MTNDKTCFQAMCICEDMVELVKRIEYMNTLHYFYMQAITELLIVTLSQHPLTPYKWYTLASA